MAEKAAGQVESQQDPEHPAGQRDSAREITATLLAHLPAIVESCGATALFIYLDALDEHLPGPDPAHLAARLFHITRGPLPDPPQPGIAYLRVPNVALTRIGQVKIAVFLALSRGLLKHGDRVVFLTGLPAARTLDTIIITDVGYEYEVFAPATDLAGGPPRILPEVIERVVDLASELGSEGREGRAVGAMFVVGDTDRVIPLTRQLILNPFKGYPPGERNILDYSLEETVKELAGLDGAFIIRGDGTLETCGAYIRTASQEEFDLPAGLGARHHAAAAVTAVTDAVAVTVSESTGTVTIFRTGRILTEIQKPRSAAEKHRLHRRKHKK